MNEKKFLRDFLIICEQKNYEAAINLQKKISNLVPGKRNNKKIRNICGLDISFDKFSNRIYAAASVHSFPDLEIIEQRASISKTEFPYIPGLLAFREGSAIVELLKKVKTSIDLYLFDGQGIAHPRGAGIASMMGLMLNTPSIGCAKSRLVGEYLEPGNKKGSSSDLVYNNSMVGKVLRTREGVKPVYVSIGYAISLKRAVEIVLACCPKYRVPEPVRQTHFLSNKLRAENIN